MQKQLFKELVKLASEKKAQGSYMGGYSPYSRRGMGGVPMMYAGRGGMMGPHPGAMQMWMQGAQQNLPREQFGREMYGEAQRFQPGVYNLGREGAKGTPEWEMANQARTNIGGYENKTEESTRRLMEAQSKVNQAASRAQAAQEQMNASPFGRIQHTAATAGGVRGALAGIGSGVIGLGGGSDAHKAYTDAVAAHQAALSDYQAQESMHKNLIGKYEGKEQQQQEREQSMQKGVLDAAGAGRKREFEDTAEREQQRRAMQQQQLQRTGSGAPQPTTTPAPAPGPTTSPNIKPTPAPTFKPRPGIGAPPAAPATPKLGELMRSNSALDSLSEGAARTMFERYVKIANAKLEISIKNAAGFTPMPPHYVMAAGLKKSPTPATTLTTAKFTQGTPPTGRAELAARALGDVGGTDKIESIGKRAALLALGIR